MNPQLPDFDTLPPEPSGDSFQSHVTVRPEDIEGHNFNPQVRVQLSNEPDVVHTEHSIEPPKYEISDELHQKHEQAKQDYPMLNLTPGEYVILNIQRHPIGLFAPIVIAVGVNIVLLSVLFSYPFAAEANGLGGTAPSFGLMAMLILPVCALVAIFAYIAIWVYQRNQFYLTNESVIQEIQHGLFSRHEQTASLGSIEDVSYRQSGILQTMLDYGSIRLSTEGDETTYRFYYVARPREQTAALTNAVEDFKNGRPVGG